MAAQETETTPLLRPRSPALSAHNSTKKKNNVSFYVTLSILFLIQTGSSIALPATTAALEEIVCARHYAHQSLDGLPLYPDCKSEPVQGSLTMVRGLLDLLLLLPGLVLGVPYAALAEKWGVKRVILLCIAGMFLQEFWFDLVCWNGAVWPVELVYLSPVFYLLGGGPSVGGSLLFVLVANGCEEDKRPTRFFLMEAAGYSGTVLGFMASGLIIDRSRWAAVLVGLILILASFILVVLVPVQHEPKEQPLPESGGGGDSGKSTLSTMRKAVTLLKEQGSLAILLTGSLLRALADSVMTLLLVYPSKVFGWSYSQSGYLASLSSTVHLAVLLALPPLQRFLSTGTSIQITDHFTLARSSALLSTLGSTGMGFSLHPLPFTCSLVVYGLGGGYNQSIRSILTLSTPEEHRAIVYTILGIMDSLGVLIGAPIWPVLYRLGLEWKGVWVGLPFLATAVLLGGVWGSLVRTPGQLSLSRD